MFDNLISALASKVSWVKAKTGGADYLPIKLGMQTSMLVFENLFPIDMPIADRFFATGSNNQRSKDTSENDSARLDNTFESLHLSKAADLRGRMLLTLLEKCPHQAAGACLECKLEISR
jgi:hypothetical protein